MRAFRIILIVALVLSPVAVWALRGDIIRERLSAQPRAAGQTAAPAGPRQITIAGSGDILVHPPTWQQARSDAAKAGQDGYEFDPIFDDIRPVVSAADLAICHMEAPMGPGSPQDFPRFRAPTDLAPAVKTAGYDTCSTSSNHALDQGEKGVYDNLDALDAAGLRHTGTFRSAAEQVRPTIYQVNGVKIGHLSYAMHFNGLKPPTGKAWLANRIDVPAIKKAAAATRKAGAQIIVLSAHWGTELVHEPSGDQLFWARKLIADPNIDLIIGHHAHVVQPFEKVGDKWIAYGVGNTLARHDFPVDANREGVIAAFTFTEQPNHRWKITRAQATPIWLSLKPTIRVVNLPAIVEHMPSVDRRRALYTAAMDRITGYLNSRGAEAAGLHIVR
ncbi:poly-gamma-glutamate synthesis protein (capsule biosynthesis protein) [Micromonospora purpureochromogenes]|uniref:Poly-gamma-glutamate synthesis protein (Capsule biosynthesis protein) n=1 Tax=Micromonospora purpureochromogenes TaxID=47872 RepID=A0A1C5AHM7_9ACTN|nr:CapA family protein [Micromonospora purpureochromogenes]SCF44738.1 poly-gamma-glutamate synthesis protein (capsule biosynthesis protein) [Micromonospora purpureochromogenes]